MKRILFAVLALVLGAAGSIRAQNPTQARPTPPFPAANGEVLGAVVDTATKEPVARASVAIRSRKDSSLITGAIAGPDGSFHIQGLRPGDYYLRTTAIGFKPRSYTFSITDAAPRANVGSLTLTRIAVTLQSVQVAGQAPTMVIEPDRNSYRAKDVAPAAANASEVLQATPSVEVDGDGKVSLRGNENVAIQINGRPTPITGPQLAAYLKQIPANIVERIEVVPNPSAKYDPEGMAGIINIVLKAQTDLGVSGGLNVGAANIDRMNAGTNLGYQSGALTLFGTYGYNADNRGISGLNDRLQYANGAPLSYTNQLIDGNTTNGGHNFSTNVDYKLTDRDVISNQFSLNRRHGFDNSLAGYTDLDAQQAFLDRYDFYRNDRSTGLVLDNSLSFKRTFEARKHELSSEVRFNRTRDEDSTVLWQQPLTPDGAISGSRILGESDQTSALTRQLTAQVDYMKQLSASTKLETGLKETSRWLDRDFLVLKDSLGDGTWLRSNLSNTFNFDDHVHAAYGVLSQSVGKFDLQGGLRAQFVNRNFALADAPTTYPYSYHSLFPSGVINYKPSDASQIKVSYSRRTRAPGTQELNPFPVFFDQQNVFIGNPQLNPEYTDAYELSTSRNGALGSIQLSPFYRHTTNAISVDINTAAVIDGRSVTSISFKNLNSSNSWGTDLNGSLRLGPKLNGFAGFNLFKIVTDGGSQSALSSSAVTWSYRVNATTQLSPTVSLQAFYFYRAPMNIPKGRFSSFQMTNITARKKLDGDNMSVSVRFADPFNTMKFSVRAGDDNLTQLTSRRFGVRATYLTFQYNFGQTPKIRLPKEEPAQPAPVFP
jgi:outer membrane receptor protein involved in Fe transport